MTERPRRPLSHRWGIAIAASLLAGILQAGEACADKTVNLVRHAEKDLTDPTDPALTADGQGRASRLRDILADAGLTKIITSELRRTKETAEPTAAKTGITPRVIPRAEREHLLEALRGANEDEVILVVSHSSELPGILAGLGYARAGIVNESDYGNIFISVLHCNAAPTIVRLRY